MLIISVIDGGNVILYLSVMSRVLRVLCVFLSPCRDTPHATLQPLVWARTRTTTALISVFLVTTSSIRSHTHPSYTYAHRRYKLPPPLDPCPIFHVCVIPFCSRLHVRAFALLIPTPPPPRAGTSWTLPRSVTSARRRCSTTTPSPSCTSSSTTAWRPRFTSGSCAPVAPKCAGTATPPCGTGPSATRLTRPWPGG